jgi:N-acetylglucosamine kinase-like BadF-type ATPase
MNYSIFSGHHKSLAVAADSNGIVGFAKLPDESGGALGSNGSLNLHCFPEEQVVKRLGTLLESLCKSMGVPDHKSFCRQGDSVVLTLPGITTDFDQITALQCLEKTGCAIHGKTFFADDTWAGLVAGLQDSFGICAFAGTGASVFLGLSRDFVRGKAYKLDGWGPMIGDYGSGFRLAMRLFEKLGRCLDSRSNPPPTFEHLFKEERELQQLQDVQNWFDRLQRKDPVGWRVRIAELARVVTKVADAKNPDPFAVSLVNEAGDDIATTICMGINHFGDDALKAPITCHGGMFRHSRQYFKRVREVVEKTCNITITLSQYNPVVGGLLIACSDDWTVPEPPVTRRLLESINALPDEIRRELDYFYGSNLTVGGP